MKAQSGKANIASADVPSIVHDVLSSSGQPLDAGTRAYMEPRFGHDFSQVRVHADARAAESAKSVNALAYTVGSDVVFAAGAYSPSTHEGRQLVAHEMAHTIQQQPTTQPMLQRRWNECGAPDQCPAREPGERERARAASLQVSTLTAPENGVIVSHFGIGSSNVSTLASNPGWAPFWGSLVTRSNRWEILGFSDCEGGVERNTELRWMRAMAVNNDLPTQARANIDRFRAAPLSDCVGENDTEEHRALNRSVVFRQTVTSYTFEPEAVQGSRCPPSSPAAVTTLSDYVSLLLCAETRTGYTPRQMLAMLRQLYYGKPWSSISQTNRWDNVIPCSLNLGNPETRLGTNLYQSLRHSSEVDGVDVGHVFTGLEAMMCPSANVPFYAGLVAVGMPNEEFATWGGDLGAAVAAMVACPRLGASAATNEDCGGRTGAQPLLFYLETVHAPSQDLEGDIDAFVMRANLLGISCAGSPRRTLSLTGPISATFMDYYNTPGTSLGIARVNRYQCLLQTIGATTTGNRITNRAAIVGPISNRVLEFADAFYVKINRFPPDVAERLMMRLYAQSATNWFLSYLESGL